MAQPLDTVGDYIAQARVILLDVLDGPYRYADQDMADYIGQAILEIRKLRPDLSAAYFRAPFPVFTMPTDETTPVSLDPMYRNAVLYYVIGKCQLRDDENNQDTRAATFLNKFVSQLTTFSA